MKQVVDYIDAVSSEDAIEMAIQSGELLYRQDNQDHDWALTLIISNMFELAAGFAEPQARFEQGFKMIMGNAHDAPLPFSWHPRFVAEAIRNLFDHGMSLDRKQTRNYGDKTKVEVLRLGFIPRSPASVIDMTVFEIEELGDNQFGLMVSPVLYWSYVQEWSKRRTSK